MASLLLPIIYLAFISLGLPDALLGAAWPTMYPQLGAQVSWAGGVSMIISACTILSALASDRLNERLGTGRVTAISVATNAPMYCVALAVGSILGGLILSLLKKNLPQDQSSES